MLRHIVIAGATGEVGKELLGLACALPQTEVRALVRRPKTVPASAAIETLFDYEDPLAYDRLFSTIPCDVLLIALGTTTAKSGNQGLLRVDRDYPIALIDALERHHPQAFIGFCSSVGADQPRGNYLRAKAAVEERLRHSPLAVTVVRPSLLLSQRQEFRLVEHMGAAFAPLWLWAVSKFAPSSEFAWKFAPIHVSTVARALLNTTLGMSHAQHVTLQGLSLHQAGE